MNHEDSTIRTKIDSPARDLKYLRLELQSGNTIFRQPFTDEPCRFQLGSPPGFTWTVEWEENGQFLFRCDEPSQPEVQVYLEEEFSLGPFRARVLDTRVLLPFALILSHDEAEENRWEFGSGVYLIGRSGKRKNHLNLNDRSISREHAKLQIDGSVACLICDSDSGLSALDGIALKRGERKTLNSGTRIQLGAYAGYWIKVEDAIPTMETRFHIKLFGGFRLERHDRLPDEPVPIRTEKARQLLSWLALQRSRTLSTQRIFEEFWPERELLRQRKNLSHILKTLQGELGLDDYLFAQLIHRTADSLTLNPDFFSSVDAWELTEAETEKLDPPMLLALHPSVLLPEIQSGWARTARHEFFLTWLRLVRRGEFSEFQKREILQQVTALLREGDFEEFVYPVAFKLARLFKDRESAQMWYLEYGQNLQRKLSETPSDSLTKCFQDVLEAIGTDSESLEA